MTRPRPDARAERLRAAGTAHGVLGPTPRGEYRLCCPFCPERMPDRSPDTKHKLHANPDTVNRNTGVRGSWWYCYRCGAKGGGDLSWLAPVEAATDDPDPEWARPPVGFREIAAGGIASEKFRHYLARRDVLQQALAVGAGYCVYDAEAEADDRGWWKVRDRVVIPMKDDRGGWRGYSARAVGDRQPKYMYPAGMNRRASLWGASWVPRLRDAAAPLWLVEGVFDALPLYPYGLASFGKNVTDQQLDLLASLGRRVVVCLDGDAWELGRATAARLRLRGTEVAWARLPPGQDPGGLGWEVRAHVQEGVTWGWP